MVPAVDLNYEVQGEGANLVVLHGLFGSLDNWRGMARMLAGHFRVWLVDQRNHGLSPHSRFFNYTCLVEDLRSFLDRMALDSVHLLGHSMGGKAAMLFASRYPARVERLIVEDIGPGAYAPRHETVFRGLLNLPLARLTSRRDAEQYLRAEIDDAGVRGFLLKSLYRQPSGTWGWRFNLPVLFAEYRTLLAALPLDVPIYCPTLFIRGEQSDYLDPVRRDALLEKFDDKRFISVPGAGHWVHADQPVAFLQAVASFLMAEK
ncbi:alpha/beta fold hydrolase [Syntrophotalea acetylenica]|uniref:alpha/beta fold hydrolase n=1 Tax=Syntrophotalea acetylenica TaxID=29542 RepID=UPI00090CA2E1|nr:alpha/beta fold hydrolase [Syntrophotalea acetylenica]APG43005.1 hypothetical protein A6070_01805 [Syntrophotalea acetylenica]